MLHDRWSLRGLQSVRKEWRTLSERPCVSMWRPSAERQSRPHAHAWRLGNAYPDGRIPAEEPTARRQRRELRLEISRAPAVSRFHAPCAVTSPVATASPVPFPRAAPRKPSEGTKKRSTNLLSLLRSSSRNHLSPAFVEHAGFHMSAIRFDPRFIPHRRASPFTSLLT